MKEIFYYNISSNKKNFVLNVYALILTIISYIFFSFILNTKYFIVNNPIYFCILVIIMFVMYEIIKVIFFKIFKPNKKVKIKFGFGITYVSMPGEKFSKYQYLIIVLSPFFIIFSILLFLKVSNIISASLCSILLAFHTGSSVVDLIYSYYIIKSNKNCVFEDTLDGFKIYK